MEDRIKQLETKLAELSLINQQLESDKQVLEQENNRISDDLTAAIDNLDKARKEAERNYKWFLDERAVSDNLRLVIASVQGMLQAFTEKK